MNETMPGLVKVGKTTRDPATRVAELSSATGVAKPFVLVFYSAFADVDVAETHIHRFLAAEGVRLTSSREFFEVDPPRAIHAVIEAPGRLSGITLPDASQDEVPRSDPLEFLFEQGFAHYHGVGDFLEDQDTGVRYWQQAAELGHPEAAIELGIHFEQVYLEEDTARTRNLALKYLRIAADSGNPVAWWRLSRAYVYESPANSEKCLAQFHACMARWDKQSLRLGHCIIELLRTIPIGEGPFGGPRLTMPATVDDLYSAYVERFRESVGSALVVFNNLPTFSDEQAAHKRATAQWLRKHGFAADSSS